MSSSNCCFLTCIQVSQEAGKVVWYSHFFQFSSLLWSTQRLSCSQWSRSRCFSGIILLFLWSNGCWQSDSSAFSKSSLNIWKFLVHVLLKPGLENFEHYLVICEMSAIVGNLNILWHWISLGLEWKLTFSSPVATAEFSKFVGILSAALSQHHSLDLKFRTWSRNSITSTSFICTDAS